MHIIVRTTFKVELVAISDEQYTSYVFKNLDEANNSFLRYITTVKCPNWEGYSPVLGDVGYIQCEYVEAGEDYFSKTTGEKLQYNYTNCYFINFVKEQQQVNNKEFNF